MTFFVGQKVTMKYRHQWSNLLPNETGPKFGRVLTVRTVETRCGETGLQFEEIVNPLNYHRWVDVECFFWAEGFRPVVERKTDISIFKKMRTPARDIPHELIDAYKLLAPEMLNWAINKYIEVHLK